MGLVEQEILGEQWGGMGPLAAQRPFSTSYPAVPESIARARHELSVFAVRAGATEEQAEAIRLAVSEAVTNAVVHAYPQRQGSITVTGSCTDSELWLLVGDTGCGLQPGRVSEGLGLGLALVAQVSDELSLHERSGQGIELQMSFRLDRS